MSDSAVRADRQAVGLVAESTRISRTRLRNRALQLGDPAEKSNPQRLTGGHRIVDMISVRSRMSEPTAISTVGTT